MMGDRKPLGKRPLGRPTKKWKKNIKKDLRETGCESGRWLAFAQDRVQWRALVLRELNLPVLLSLLSVSYTRSLDWNFLRRNF
jgi:hypothetical protein